MTAPEPNAPADLSPLKDWIGRTEQRGDWITAAPLAALSATLDRPDPEPLPGCAVPPLWHWLYFLPMARQSEIGEDGHPRRGGFLPPVPLPRRMWAGSRIEFHHPLQVGDEVTRQSRILNVETKTGRSGTLVFVTVRHEVTNARGLALSEEHDIVYREASPPTGAGSASSPGSPTPTPPPPLAPTDETFSRAITPDPVLLFRYSALTFNGHRIHYDQPYVTQVEGYPGLIVHGPLIATLLLDLLRRQQPEARVKRFAFTAMKPLFDIHPFTVCGKPEADGGGHPNGRHYALWARNHEGHLAMRASAELA